MGPRVHLSARCALARHSGLPTPATDARTHGLAFYRTLLPVEKKASALQLNKRDNIELPKEPKQRAPRRRGPHRHTQEPRWTKKNPRGTFSWDQAWRHQLYGLDLIDTITLDSIHPSETSVSSASEAKLLCTYNWRDLTDPHIYVPGAAPTWRNTPLPITIPRDTGSHFIDQNSARSSGKPMEPLFRAVAATNKQFRFNDVDVVVDRNSLRKLLKFCNGQTDSAFRLKLSLVHNTLLVERREKKACQQINRTHLASYGHNFEKTFTEYPPRLQDSTAHHRVLLYPLGHLRCAVRFEADACYKGPGVAGSPDAQIQYWRPPPIKHGTIATRTRVTPTFAQGATAPQSAVAEVKTAAGDRDLARHLPQLWFGRTPWLIVGRHENGTFHHVDITNVSAEFASWETRQQIGLQKLVTVLERFREEVRQNGAQSCLAECDRKLMPPVLRILQDREKASALPKNLIANFWT